MGPKLIWFFLSVFLSEVLTGPPLLGLSASFVVVGGRDAAAVWETACLLLLPEVMADPPTRSESKRRSHGHSWQAGGGRDAAARLETSCLLFGSWLA